MQAKYQILKWCGILMLSWCLSPLFAQSEIETKTLALFDTPVTWVKNYDGLIDGEHPASMILAFDGFNCKGFLNFTSSNTEYKLEGSLESNRLILLEKYQGNPSGYVEGGITEEGAKLKWISMNEEKTYMVDFSIESNVQSESNYTILSGVLDEQSVRMIAQDHPTHTTAELVFDDGTQNQKLYGEDKFADSPKLKNITLGYTANLVNTKADQYVASFILPGATTASKLELTVEEEVVIDRKVFLSHNTQSSISIPSINEKFDLQMLSAVEEWVADIEAHKNVLIEERFANTSKVWFELEDFSKRYISGILYYSNSWNEKLVSKSFTYDRVKENVVNVAPFLKGSSKWENKIKQQMLAAKTLNSDNEQDHYEEWINKANLIDPILCKNGLQFYTESNAVFGQANTFVPWSSLAPLVISTSKLNKLRKVK